mmetsp:Transcript_11954/g.25685  ORF Transcript_11954/g.25685 Transcript_11954/m.25685 type:complete len:129 (+) Transcript_11954:194-580(+)
MLDTSTASAMPRCATSHVSKFISLTIFFIMLVGIVLDNVGIEARRVSRFACTEFNAESLLLRIKLAFITLVRRAPTTSSSAEEAVLLKELAGGSDLTSPEAKTFGIDPVLKFFLRFETSECQSTPVIS